MNKSKIAISLFVSMLSINAFAEVFETSFQSYPAPAIEEVATPDSKQGPDFSTLSPAEQKESSVQSHVVSENPETGVTVYAAPESAPITVNK